MSIVDKTVQDCISQRGIANGLVPVINGEPAGDDRGAAATAILQDFQQIADFGWGKDGQAPITQDQQAQLGDGLAHAGVKPVPSREGECIEEARYAVIDHTSPFIAPTKDSVPFAARKSYILR